MSGIQKKLNQHFKLKKLFYCWFPHKPTSEQKQARVDKCKTIRGVGAVRGKATLKRVPNNIPPEDKGRGSQWSFIKIHFNRKLTFEIWEVIKRARGQLVSLEEAPDEERDGECPITLREER
ncbi:hypothetical protein EVAR_13404_1 [Eumeta japonica]|uniref:Uncharacterized protein n=1 Tax=Eumeta variegata TaxID=151549 RepID=A0A4C1V748_EUMVA|nr:hypothetical protein EVAR_13404_1 [Eumeta japonica]